MLSTPNACRLEAQLFQQAAQWISLQSDREELLATARSLLLRADALESRLSCSPTSTQTGAKLVDIIDLETG